MPQGIPGSRPLCSATGCNKPASAKGRCPKHYQRWRRLGTTDLPPRPTVEELFWAKVDKGDGTGCWLWTGSTMPYGHGQVRIARRTWLAHRYAYTLLVGPIPEGLTLDHVKTNGCTSTACVKAVADEHGPAHLEPVTLGENTLRGDAPSAINARKTHCPQGHPYDEANTWSSRDRNQRICRTCRRENMRRYSASGHKTPR